MYKRNLVLLFFIFLLAALPFSAVFNVLADTNSHFSADNKKTYTAVNKSDSKKTVKNSSVLSLRFGPNPFRPKNGETLTIELTPEKSATPLMLSGKVMFIDCLGNVINKATFRNASGKVTMKWDGKDDSGSLVNPGTYTLKLNVENETSGRIQLEKPLSMLIGVRE